MPTDAVLRSEGGRVTGASEAVMSPEASLQCSARLPSSCICFEHGHLRTQHQLAELPSCVATAACSEPQQDGPAFRERRDLRTAIGIFFGFNRKRVRYVLGPQPFASYLKDITLAMRLVLSLRRVGTQLPIQLHVSGERHARYEAKFVELGVEVVPAREFKLPRWTNPWHSGSFSKLGALMAAGMERLIVLDVDAVALRNIDHLSGAPTPSLTYMSRSCGRACCWDINSGVMVVSPNAEEGAKVAAQLNHSANRRTAAGDGGDQSFWRHFFPRVHELPAAYNAEKRNNLSDWRAVWVLHDFWGARWSRWWLEGLQKVNPELARDYSQLTVNATRLMNTAAQAQPNRTKVVCYRKHAMVLCDEDPHWQPPAPLKR